MGCSSSTSKAKVFDQGENHVPTVSPADIDKTRPAPADSVDVEEPNSETEPKGAVTQPEPKGQPAVPETEPKRQPAVPETELKGQPAIPETEPNGGPPVPKTEPQGEPTELVMEDPPLFANLWKAAEVRAPTVVILAETGLGDIRLSDFEPLVEPPEKTPQARPTMFVTVSASNAETSPCKKILSCCQDNS